jgi:hypothetical protein
MSIASSRAGAAIPSSSTGGGALNKLQFTGEDFFADQAVCCIVLEVPNSALGSKEVGLWHRTLVPAHCAGGGRFRRSAVRPLQLFPVLGLTSPERAPEIRRTMSVSLPLSPTRWSTRVGVRGRSMAGGRDNAAGDPAL